MNTMQARQAMRLDVVGGELPTAGIAYAMTRVTIANQTFSRGQPIGVAADLMKSCQNWRAMVANQIVEIRPA